MRNLEPLLLWVPGYQESTEERYELIEKVTLANNSILDFSEGVITLDDAFQAIEHYGANIDDYRENLAETIRIFESS